jgi:hypothetical protein
VDRQDEILCPYDIDFVRRVFVGDDEFRDYYRQLPAGANLEIILDSCHSGTATRMPPGSLEYREARYLEPPVDYRFHSSYRPDLATRRLLRSGAGQRDLVIVPGLNHALWAAARDSQTAEETTISGHVRGVFTYHFCQILRNTNGSILRIELDGLVTAALRRAGYAQVPQLETWADGARGLIFGRSTDSRPDQTGLSPVAPAAPAAVSPVAPAEVSPVAPTAVSPVAPAAQEPLPPRLKPVWPIRERREVAG